MAGGQDERGDGLSARSSVVSVRLPPDLAAKASEAAQAAGLTLSEFVRRAAMGQRITRPPAPQVTFMAPNTYSANALEVIWETPPANTTSSGPVTLVVSYR